MLGSYNRYAYLYLYVLFQPPLRMMEDSGGGPGGGSGGEDPLEDDAFYSSWDCDGCPPPYFDLPPPPRPDFMEDADYCTKSSSSSPYDSCEVQPVVVIDSQLHLENDLLNLLLIVISALVLVLVILVIAVVIWR